MIKHYISQPCAASRWGYQRHHGWELHVAPEWAKNCDNPPLTTVAECTSQEAIEAAKRLLVGKEEQHGQG